MTFLITKLLLFFFFWYSMMCLSSSIPSDYSILGDDLDKFTSDKEVLGLFQLWQKEHEREYQNLEDEANRFEIFKSNLKYIREKNAERKSSYDYRLDLNKFADMTYEEFSEIYLSKTELIDVGKGGDQELNDDFCKNPPASLDWRKKGAVTKVKNQGGCGSCWAFAATGAIEGINAIVTGRRVSVSTQEIVDCVYQKEWYGCRGGWYHEAFKWVVNNGGISKEADYLYTATNGTCNTTIAENKKVVTITGYESLPKSENSLFCAVLKQPVSVALDVERDFIYYSGGIFDGVQGNCTNSCNVQNHAVLIVGYDTLNGEDYWIVKNSWGRGWGLKGYIWIKRNRGSGSTGTCGISCYPAYPTKENSAAAAPSLMKRGYSSI